METPKKIKTIQITESLEKLQRSPIFDFLDTLSPIKPVKASAYVRESNNPLSLASFPSAFTSPHEKSLKDFSSSQRHHFTDLTKPNDPSSDDRCNVFAPKYLERDKENIDPIARGPTSFDASKILASPENADCSNNVNLHMDLLYRDDVNSSLADEHGWENFVTNEILFAFLEPCEDPATTYYQNIKNAMKNMMMLSHGNPIEKIGYEYLQQRSESIQGLSRRSFVYPDSNSSDIINPSKQKQAVTRNDSSHQFVFSRVGLQLSSLSRNPSEFENESSTSFDRKSITTKRNQDFPKKDRYKDVRERATDASSPNNNKRRKSEPIEPCKRCNCKKSKCLKLYCECFAAGNYCSEPCACIDCFNKPLNAENVITTRKQIESRNPLAFAPKVVVKGDNSSLRSEIVGNSSSTTPSSARHKRGCNCKKSGCLKRYCECYQSGVGCSINCRCEGCKNAFGRKDGFVVEREVECVVEGEEDEDQLWQLRTTNGFVLPSNQKRPRFPFYEDSDKDEIPEILNPQFRQPSNKLVLSPNGKRVSPPQTRGQNSKMHSSPGFRRSILTSMPSFPSLAAFIP